MSSLQPQSPTDRPSPDSPLADPLGTPSPHLSLSAYDYHLPIDRIAQNPAHPRDSSRLLLVDSPVSHQHKIFRELPELLQPGDLLVLNDTRVIPARLYGRKVDQRDRSEQPGSSTKVPSTKVPSTKVEILLLEEQQQNCWLALVKPGKRLKLGSQIEFGQDLADPSLKVSATVIAIDPATGGRLLQFQVPEQRSLLTVLPQLGIVPLPPYITDSQADPEQYQTVYADRSGSVAAPTAGLHFTPELLRQLQASGIQQAFVTLHVGIGTFRPVEAEDITQHQMHGEWVEVPSATVEAIHKTKAQGGRVIAVGTTAARSLEGASESGTLQAFCDKTELFIYPGYDWKTVDGLITNFHLPKSSLLMLVSALIGQQRLLELYEVAIAENYRFYSFGDAMLILPEARVF